MRKSIKYSLLALLAVMGLASCNNNDFEYTGAEAVKNAQVFFADKTLAVTSYNLDMNATSFDVEIQRVKTEGELTVNLENHQNPNSTTQLDVPATVTFADGADKATITIGYNPETIQFDDLNRDTIVIADAEYTTPYGGTEYRFAVSIAAPWEDMGMATYREALISHWFNIDNMEYGVPIQKDLTRPGVYRLVNPYGNYYPLTQQGVLSYASAPDGELEYMVVHAEDPEHVWVEYSPTMLSVNTEYGCFRFWSVAGYYIDNGTPVEEVIAAHPELFGTLEEGIITMPVNSMLISMELYQEGGFYQCNDEGLFAIALPGYELVSYDYTATALFAGVLKTPAEKNEAVVDFTLAADVAKAKFAMTEASVSEADAAAAIVSGELEAQEITEGGRFYLPLEEDGKYRVTIVTFDAEGAAQETASCVFEFTKGESPWQSLGYGVYTDDIVGPLFENDPITYEVEVLEHKDTPGLYRLKNPYGADYPYNEKEGMWDASMDYYLEINAVDPTAVYFEQQELGVDWGYGMMSAVSNAARYIAAGYSIEVIKANNIAFGTLENGVITFPVKDLIVFDDDGGYYANLNGAFKLVLPDAASPSAIKAAKFAQRLRGGKHASRTSKSVKLSFKKNMMKTNVKDVKVAPKK